MDNEAKKFFELLDDDVLKLNREWVTFQDLYSKSDETVKILGETAPSFFSILWNLLIESIFLTICRLTDPKRSAGKDNLSIVHLISKIHNTDLKMRLSSINDEIMGIRDPIRIWRDKHISHTDLDIKLSPEDNPLPEIPYKDLDSIISKINEFMNLLWMEVNNSQKAYSSYMIDGGAESLIGYLQLGKNYSNGQFDIKILISKLQKKLSQLD